MVGVQKAAPALQEEHAFAVYCDHHLLSRHGVAIKVGGLGFMLDLHSL